MEFYKVTKELDQVQFKGGFLVGGELITEKEGIRLGCIDILKAKAERIKVSKFKTHWFFGVRRQNSITN